MTAPVCPLPLERLLVCTDGSPASQGAVAGALDLARVCGSQLFFLQILEYQTGLTGLAPEAELEWDREAAAYLEELQSEAERLGIRSEALIRRGAQVYAVIVEEARHLKADLIVMGRHGKRGLTKLLVGSVTERVIGLSPVSVLVFPQEWPLPWERVLVASDGSPYSQVAWEAALEQARRLGTRLLGLSVAREEGELPGAEAVVGSMLSEANRQGIPLEIRVSVGAPDDVIVRTAWATQADLIILGSHGLTGWKRLLMGSTTARVLGSARCPVLVVKRE